MNPRFCIRRLNRVMISAAAKHVGMPKPGKICEINPRSARRHQTRYHPQTDGAVKPRGISRGVRLSKVAFKEARRTEFEGNPDPTRAWSLIEFLPFHCLLRTTNVLLNRLSFDKTKRSQARYLKKALQILTAAKSCCSPFTIRELEGWTTMAKAELLSIFNESFSKGVVPGIWK